MSEWRPGDRVEFGIDCAGTVTGVADDGSLIVKRDDGIAGSGEGSGWLLHPAVARRAQDGGKA